MVDVDGTICNNLPKACEFIHNEYGVRLSPTDVTEWEYTVEEAGVDLGDVFDHLMQEKAEWYMRQLHPIEGARRALDQLSNYGYELWIVTHRHAETHHLTQQWLSEQGFSYDNYVTDVPTNKGAVPGDVLIDDYHGNIRDAAEEGKVGILLDRPYNTLPKHDRAFVASDWAEVTKLLTQTSIQR